MKIFFMSLFAFLIGGLSEAQSLYIKTFGDKNAKPVIFLHGGPGYNCASFEGTTAKKLSENGFFVIVYDRRGEGRSTDNNAKYTFDETFADLKSIYTQYALEKATLMGHSFGGIVATLFAEKNPKMIQSIVLVGAPVSLQETFKTIIKSSKNIYASNGDSTNMNYARMLELMDPKTMEYASYCFSHAMQNGFYAPKNRSAESTEIYEALKKDTLKKYASQMTIIAPRGFSQNEKYTTLDLTKNLQKLVGKGIPIYGLYGKEDGLYSPEQIAALQKIIGEANLKYLDNCSHSVFIDQQSVFIEAMKNWNKQ